MNHAFLQLAAFGKIAAKVALIVAVGFINNFKEGILEIVLQKIFQEFLFCTEGSAVAAKIKEVYKGKIPVYLLKFNRSIRMTERWG